MNELKITADINGLHTRAIGSFFKEGDIIHVYYTQTSTNDTLILSNTYFQSTTATHNDIDWNFDTSIYHLISNDTCLIICASYNFNIYDTIGSTEYMHNHNDTIDYHDRYISYPFINSIIIPTQTLMLRHWIH